MRILTISDVVEVSLYPNLDRDRFSAIDLILACGDLPPEYLSYLVDALKVPLFFVRANHDIRYDTKPPLGASSAHANVLLFRGIKIMGLDGSHWYNGGPNQYSEWQMRLIVYRMLFTIWRRGGIDIIMTFKDPSKRFQKILMKTKTHFKFFYLNNSFKTYK